MSEPPGRVSENAWRGSMRANRSGKQSLPDLFPSPYGVMLLSTCPIVLTFANPDCTLLSL